LAETSEAFRLIDVLYKYNTRFTYLFARNRDPEAYRVYVTNVAPLEQRVLAKQRVKRHFDF